MRHLLKVNASTLHERKRVLSGEFLTDYFSKSDWDNLDFLSLESLSITYHDHSGKMYLFVEMYNCRVFLVLMGLRGLAHTVEKEYYIHFNGCRTVEIVEWML